MARRRVDVELEERVTILGSRRVELLLLESQRTQLRRDLGGASPDGELRVVVTDRCVGM
jgi:hypothetical protein